MRNVIATLAIATLLTGTSSAAFSQENPLPQQCRQAGAEQMAGMDTPKMDASAMDEAHQAYMASMMKMEPAMMEGIKAKDADVAFICGMIAHHQGAIDMAEVELKYGDNADAKKKAQVVIDAQKKEIKDYAKWLKTNAK
ncbi:MULTISPECIES: CopM family metallochaperone [Mesorhizobium]|uniref:CopM family metallochaperone n=2 Tax=Phyllobacteriaceae TaxID=69277 RepID=UPI000FCBD4A4|nr:MULTISPECIES: DUF305 domain-containing protein [Mesorhizobium]RUY34963.1 DUF305 domain-containing protein [Mesorhizobium sp. M7A.F.Ca.US.001.04.1.1]